MVRYSFLVGLFHPRLHAGLSRRLRRGRDSGYPLPPAQTRACGATAHGSYLGCDPFRNLASGEYFCFARLRTPAGPWNTYCPALVGYVLGSLTFSLVPGLPSTTSATDIPAGSVRRLRWYYARVRLLADVHDRIVLLASRPDPPFPMDTGEVSRFSRVQFLDVLMALGLRRA